MKKAVFILAAIASATGAIRSQQALPDLSGDGRARSGYWAKWDRRAGELIYFRNIDSRTAPAIRILKGDGSTVPICPLEDLAGAQAITIWDVAETPDGGAVFSAIAEYAPPHTKPMPLKSLVLTYDSSGRLTKFWDVYPYHHHHIAVDERGDVYGLGAKDSKDPDYPVLVKYSPDGKELGAFLPAGMFSAGVEVVESSPANGESEMFVEGEDLFLWLAPTQEILKLSPTGVLRSRSSLEGALNTLAAQSGSKRVKMTMLSSYPNGELIAQVQLWPKDAASTGLQSAMAIFSSDGSSARFTSAPIDFRQTGLFLGVSQDGKLVFMERGSEPGQVAVLRRY